MKTTNTDFSIVIYESCGANQAARNTDNSPLKHQQAGQAHCFISTSLTEGNYTDVKQTKIAAVTRQPRLSARSLLTDSALCMFFLFFFPFFLPEIQQSFKVLISQPLEHTLLKHDELLPAMITGAFFFFFFFFKVEEHRIST